MYLRVAVCSLFACLAACAKSSEVTDRSKAAGAERRDRARAQLERGAREREEQPDLQPTYHGGVRAIIEKHCLGCHVEGGIGPMRLDDYESVAQVRALVVAAVMAGNMPPWPASDDCRELRDARRVSDAELAVLQAWREAGFPDGNEADYEAPARVKTVALPEPDLTLQMRDSYVPDIKVADEYRCFLTDGVLDRDTYVTAMDIKPGTRQQVHHVQVHKVPVAEIETIEALDQAAEGIGYPCGGGAGQGVTSVNIFSWRPGSAAIVFEEGDAALLEAGSTFVLQVHYNNQFLPEGGPVPDLSGVAFWTLAEGSEPEFVVTRRSVVAPVGPPKSGFALGVIAAGESHVVGESAMSMRRLSTVGRRYVQGEIVGMTPHMHGLGTRHSASLRGAEEQCMVDVPDWDFEWQLDYTFAEPVEYGPNDVMNVRCEYDNSASNQPLIDGMRIAPRDVGWGEGTLDEMCLNYVWLRFPREAFAAASRR